MKNCIFLDVDGTLVTQKGDVPISAQEAIKKTRALGNLVFLSTGRSKSELTDDILDIGFDGIIGAGGAYIEYNNEIIKHEKMTESQALKITEYLDSYHVGYYLESNQGLFPSQHCYESIKVAAHRLFEKDPTLFVNKEDPEPHWFYNILRMYEGKPIPYNDINKISFISNDKPFDEIAKEFEDEFTIHHGTVFEFGPNSGEIGLNDIDKKLAIEELMRHIKEPIGNTYAYGDGLNDITMFECVDHAVAMDNARRALKDVADEITQIAEQDGIYNSFVVNKLI